MLRQLLEFFPRSLTWKRIAIESVIFLFAYLAWLFFTPPEAAARPFIGSLAVLTPLASATLSTFLLRSRLPAPTRLSWSLWGISFALWASGNFVRTIYQALLNTALPQFSLADVLNFSGYLTALSALIFSPGRSRFAPSRFRFLLDAVISSGVVIVLGWLVIARPAVQATSGGGLALSSLVYPLADLALLMILFNASLVSSLTRRTSLLLGLALLFFFASDYIYAYQAAIQSFEMGTFTSLGWVLGGLTFGLTAALEVDSPSRPLDTLSRLPLPPDPAARLQNILPLLLVLTLIWFILADWRLRGALSLFGFWAAVFLSLALVIRLGVRAGEIELYKYWQLFAGLAESAFICDGRGRILLANPALSRALGKPESQVIGSLLTDCFSGIDSLPRLLGLAATDSVNREVQILPSGVPCLLSLAPIFTDDRKPLIAGVAYDIREQKEQQRALENAYHDLQVVSHRLEELNAQLEEKVAERTRVLQQAYAQLEEQNRMLQALDQLKSDFVSLVSHELRTPLTSLRGGLELLLARPDRRPEDRETMQLMSKEVQRLTHFVENVLDLSALEAGRLVAHLEPVDLSLVVRDAVRGFQRLPGAERIRLMLPEEMPLVLADETFLHSVFTQLLDNALKYAPTGPITIEVQKMARKLRVCVSDEGPGIPPEKRKFLFMRFQRLEARDSQSVYGYGLGLYLSRQMMLAQQSDLRYKPSPAGGASFYFDLKVLK